MEVTIESIKDCIALLYMRNDHQCFECQQEKGHDVCYECPEKEDCKAYKAKQVLLDICKATKFFEKTEEENGKENAQ